MRRVATLALLLSTFCILPTDSAAGSTPRVTRDDAMGSARELVASVIAYSAHHPTAAGAMPLWEGGPVEAEDAVLVHSYPDLEPCYYYVLMAGPEGGAAGFVTLSAVTGEWQAYGTRPEGFPSVDRTRASRLARRSLGVEPDPASLRAVMMPDRRFYWHWNSTDGARELFVCTCDTGTVLREPPVPSPDLWEPTASNPDLSEGATERPGSRARPDYDYPPAFDITDVPFYYQISEDHCAAAAVQMVLSYWGPGVDQTDVADVANTGLNGTHLDDMTRAGHFSAISTAIQNMGLHGYDGRRIGMGAPAARWSYPDESDPDFPNRHHDLKSLISDGRPVILVTRYDEASFGTHARVVKGYDDSTGVYIVHDPWFAGPYQGPDLHFNQSFLDELWSSSRRWGCVIAPWQVQIDAPAEVIRGLPFTVTARVTYVGPGPLGGQHEAYVPSVEVLPSEFCHLAPQETSVHELNGWFSDTGCEYDPASWELVADTLAQTGVLRLLARGIIHESSHSYPSYSDSIGGRAECAISVADPEFVTVDAAGAGHFSNIQDAIDFAGCSCPVMIAPGTYTGPRNRNLSFNGRNVRLVGAGPDATILDCLGQGRAFVLADGEGRAALIEGLTVRNGMAPGDETEGCGGAIHLDGASPTIRNVVLESSASPGCGGGVCCDNGSSPLLDRVRFVRNRAETGEGGGLVSLNGSAPHLERCSFLDNSARTSGGAISVGEDSSPEIVGCTLALNSARSGGGIYCWGASPLIIDTIVFGSASGRGIACGGSASPVLAGCCIYGNAGGDELPGSCVADCTLFSDPLLCDASNGALQLQECSPCIGAGSLGGDIGAFPSRCACLEADVIGETLVLHAATPSPFHSATDIQLDVPPEAGRIRLAVYNVRGQVVRSLANRRLSPGAHHFAWSGVDDSGADVGSGVYLVRCECGELLRTTKVVFVR